MRMRMWNIGSSAGSAQVAAILMMIAGCISLGGGQLGAQNACIKSIASSPTLNGAVVPGVLGCPNSMPDTVWQGVSPVELWSGSSPSGSLAPGGYIYLAFRDTNPDRLWVGIDIAGDDNLTDFDIIYLLFDADRSGTWNSGDFMVKVPASSSTALINSGGQCGAACGAKEYWEHNGTSFQQVAGPEAAINANVAFDYETAIDPEQKIWNVEIDMPIAQSIAGGTRFNLNTTGPNFFAMGAYVFVDRNRLEQPNPQQGTVLRWPQTMVDRTISQQNLFGVPASQPGQLGGVSLTNSCFDVNFAVSDPWRINGFVANEFDNRIIRNAVNTFRVRFRYQGPDGGAGTLSNPGQVRLSLKPYNGGGAGTAFVKTKTLPTPAVNDFPAEYTVDFTWNFGSAAESWSAFESATGSQVNFICATMELMGFARDDIGTNNRKVVNHNEFTTSEYTHELAIFGDSIPGLAPGQNTTLRLQMQPMNDPSSSGTGGGGGGTLRFVSGPTMTMLWALTALLGLVAIASGRRRRMRLRAGYALIVIAVVLAGCQTVSQVVQGQTRWQVTNAGEIGLRALRGEPGWYELPIRHGEVKRLSLRFTGRPLPYNTVQQRLAPVDAAGRPNFARFDVRPGQVVTVVAFGEVDFDGRNGPLPPTSPTGFALPRAARAVENPLLLRDGYYQAMDYAGALIGTFDNWERSFVIGRSASFLVPQNARQLQLAVNGLRQGSRMMIDAGMFDINVIMTPGPRAPTHTHNRGDATFSIPPSYDPWRILTSLNVYSYHILEDRNPAGRVISQTLRPLGEAHYSVYATH